MPQAANEPGQEPEVRQTPDPSQEAPPAPQEPAAPQGEQAPATEPEAPQEPAQTPGESGEDASLWEGIPEEHPLRETVTSLRSESAARRTENRRLQEANTDLRSQLESAKSAEEYQQAIADYDSRIQAAELETARERAGRKHGLPDALVTRLAGNTAEELEADAEALKALVAPAETPPPPTGPRAPARGGLDPNQDRVDPAATADSIRRRSASGVTSM